MCMDEVPCGMYSALAKDWSNLKLWLSWDHIPASLPFLNIAPHSPGVWLVVFGLSSARTFAPGLGLSPSNATAERERERADTSVSANSVLPGTCEL